MGLAPLIVHFDFESFLTTPSELSSTNKTETVEVHQPTGYAFDLVDHTDERPIYFDLGCQP